MVTSDLLCTFLALAGTHVGACHYEGRSVKMALSTMMVLPPQLYLLRSQELLCILRMQAAGEGCCKTGILPFIHNNQDHF